MTLTRLDWTTTNAVLEQRGNGRAILDIETEPPRLEMEQTKPRLHIDQSEPYAQAGLKSPERLLADHVAYAKQMLAQGIQRVVSNGDQMIDIHSGYDAIVEQADANAFGIFEKEFVYGVIPSTPPRITFEPGSTTYRLIPGRVINNTQNRSVEFTYRPHHIEFFTR